MGSIYARGTKLWLRFKGHGGKWIARPTDFHLGQERDAKRLLIVVEAKVKAGTEVTGGDGPLTVARYAERWISERQALGVADWQNDHGRLRDHVLPVIGAMKIDEVRARHLVDLVRRLRSGGELAPKTIYNLYSVLKALFRDAQIADLIEASPCILTKHQLGENVDKDPEWRDTARFRRDELEQLLFDERVPADRRVLYALQGLAGLRHGEAAGLCWRHYDPTKQPLGSLMIATSYAKGRTKTKRTRYVPVHPALAEVLAEWKTGGWEKMIGRTPAPDDLVVPMPAPKRGRQVGAWGRADAIERGLLGSAAGGPGQPRPAAAPRP